MLMDLHGIVWSAPTGSKVPRCMGLLEPLGEFVYGEYNMDVNWIDCIRDMTSHIYTPESTIFEVGGSTTCINTAHRQVPFISEFVYPNTIIKIYRGGTIVYETVTPIEADKTLVMWHIKNGEYSHQYITSVECDHFQEMIFDRLDSMVVDDMENTFIML
jgi:hypothetical protein